MKNNILINQSVAILCDGNNIERSIHEEAGNTNTMINFDKIIPRLLNERGLNRLIYFREGKAISSKLAERLHNNFYGSVVACHKTADIPLSIKATQLASKVDTIIIMSGDSDFLDLVQHLKSEGVRVEIAAVRKTTARTLMEGADYFHPITRDDWFSYNSGSKRSFNQRRGINPNNVNTKTSESSTSFTPPVSVTENKVEEKPFTMIPNGAVEPISLPGSKAKESIPADPVKKPVLKKKVAAKKESDIKKEAPKKTASKKKVAKKE
jgi:uncharacterized LabA/DUF88 family protein